MKLRPSPTPSEEPEIEYTIGNKPATIKMGKVDIQTGEILYYDSSSQTLLPSVTNLGHNMSVEPPVDYTTLYEPLAITANGSPVYMMDTDYPIYLIPSKTGGEPNSHKGELGIMVDDRVVTYHMQGGSGIISLTYVNT